MLPSDRVRRRLNRSKVCQVELVVVNTINYKPSVHNQCVAKEQEG